MSTDGRSSDAADTGSELTWEQLEAWCRLGDAKLYAADAGEAYHGKKRDFSWVVTVAVGLVIAIPAYSWLIAAARRLGEL